MIFFIAVLRIRITLMRIRILFLISFDAVPDPMFYPSFQMKAEPLKSAQLGSYSRHFGLSSADGCGSGSSLSLCCGSGSWSLFDADQDHDIYLMRMQIRVLKIIWIRIQNTFIVQIIYYSSWLQGGAEAVGHRPVHWPDWRVHPRHRSVLRDQEEEAAARHRSQGDKRLLVFEETMDPDPDWIQIQRGPWIGIRIGYVFNGVPGSGSGSRRAKMTHKHRRKVYKVRAGCSFWGLKASPVAETSFVEVRDK